MPMADFIKQTMAVIRSGATDEVVVEGVKALRHAEANGQYDAKFAETDAMFAQVLPLP